MSKRLAQDELQKIVEYLRKDADFLGRMDERLINAETCIGKLERLVINGDGGGQSLIFLVKMLQSDVDSAHDENVEMKRDNAEITRLRNQTRTAVIVAVIAAIAAIASAFIGAMGKG